MRPVIPELPAAAADQEGEAELGLRYEDVCQDGRLRIEGIWPPMGRILWNEARMGASFSRLAARGIHNVLARVVMRAEDVPISPRVRALSRVRYQLGHTRDASGEVNRIVLGTWLTTESVPSRRAAHAFPAGQRQLVARAYGQHVFTRPSAPPEQRRVVRLDNEALPAVPEARVELPSASELLEAPAGCHFIDPEPRTDAAPLVFGLAHTDLNQHVNFLTYPRCVEDAALRHLAGAAEQRVLLGRGIELAYMKPCFAGDRMRIVLRAFASDSDATLGVCAAFVRDAAFGEARSWESFGRAHCIARLWLS